MELGKPSDGFAGVGGELMLVSLWPCTSALATSGTDTSHTAIRHSQRLFFDFFYKLCLQHTICNSILDSDGSDLRILEPTCYTENSTYTIRVESIPTMDTLHGIYIETMCANIQFSRYSDLSLVM